MDEWRAEFGAQLRVAGGEALAQLREKMPQIKPDALAYTLAVLVDKAATLEGRNQINASTVNVQVNHYGTSGPSKADILAGLSSVGPAVQMAVKSLETGNAGQMGSLPLTHKVSEVG